MRRKFAIAYCWPLESHGKAASVRASFIHSFSRPLLAIRLEPFREGRRRIGGASVAARAWCTGPAPRWLAVRQVHPTSLRLTFHQSPISPIRFSNWRMRSRVHARVAPHPTR